MADFANLLQYGAMGLLLAVLAGVYFLLRAVFKQFSEENTARMEAAAEQLKFIQDIALQSIANQAAHAESWRAMTDKTLDTITGYTIAFGELTSTLKTEAELLHQAHAKNDTDIADLHQDHRKMEERIMSGLRKEPL